MQIIGKTRIQAEERRIVMASMMMVGGMMGGYTYVLRGRVFCNAQTGNLLKMGVALGNGKLSEALYFLIPFLAYVAGTILSEFFRNPNSSSNFFKWTTRFTALELLAFFLIGWIPLSAPHQIAQVLINFVASMQYNSFRSVEGTNMATTFCTNHVRQTGLGLASWLKTRSKAGVDKMLLHGTMLACFLSGVVIITLFAPVLQEKTLWLAFAPLGLVFGILLQEDLKQNKVKTSL